MRKVFVNNSVYQFMGGHMKPCMYECIRQYRSKMFTVVVLAALGNGLLDRDGSISITNDGEINGNLVLTVRHHVMQPLVVTLYLWSSAICNLCTLLYIDQRRSLHGQSKQDGNNKNDDIVWTDYFGALMKVGDPASLLGDLQGLLTVLPA